ncbi:HAD family hydrolase (plasmid) [Streptomyces sp. CA-256286]|nr:HAD family hydrolase [Streptomyces sp. CA-256286]
MEAAPRAGMGAVALLSGGIPRADLEWAGADAVYRDVADLLDHLKDSPFGPGPG